MKKVSSSILLLALSMPLGAEAAAIIDLTPTVYAEEAGVESVETTYRETGHLLALLPVTFTVTARAHASGGIELDYPWYSAFTVDRRDRLASELKVAVDAALHKLDVGRVRAEGKGSKASFTREEAAAAEAAMTEVLEQNFGPRMQE